MSWLILIAMAVAAVGSTEPPQESASLTLTPPVIPFHKQSVLTLSIEVSKASSFKLPDVSKYLNGLELVEPLQQTETTNLPNGNQRVVYSGKVEGLWTGTYPIGPIPISFEDGQILTLPAIALVIRDLTPDEQAAVMQFAANAPPLDPPNPWVNRWLLITITLLAFLIPLAMWLYRKWRHNRVQREKSLTPWEKAYERLRKLDEMHLPQKGEHDLFYVELSSILRYYIEERFSINAPEQTTPEFLAEAARSGLLSREQQNLLARFLTQSDRVKFARYVPTVLEMEESLANVLFFIDETVPVMNASQEVAA